MNASVKWSSRSDRVSAVWMRSSVPLNTSASSIMWRKSSAAWIWETSKLRPPMSFNISSFPIKASWKRRVFRIARMSMHAPNSKYEADAA